MMQEKSQLYRLMSVRNFLACLHEREKNQLTLAESYSALRAGNNKGQTLSQTFVVFLYLILKNSSNCAIFYNQHTSKDFIIRLNIYVLLQTYTRD